VLDGEAEALTRRGGRARARGRWDGAAAVSRPHHFAAPRAVGIDSISVTAASLLRTITAVHEAEQMLARVLAAQ
jgi:hypothetical protein